MKLMENHNITRCAGLLLIFSALSICLISIIELVSNEVMLTQNLSMEEVWRYEGALKWWKVVYNTTILPATAILMVSGILTILRPKLLSIFVQKRALRKLEQNIKETL